MKNKFIALLLTMLMAAFSATAQAWQSDIENFDESLWTDETMVYVKIVSEGESVSGYSVLAYIDGQLRGYAPVPRTLGGTPPCTSTTCASRVMPWTWARRLIGVL